MPQLTERQVEFLRRFLGVRPSGKVPISPEENDRLQRLLPDELVGTDLTRCDTKELFDESYMHALKDAVFKGESDPDLKELMREVVKGVSGPRREEVMVGLAAIVGTPPTAKELGLDYERFLIVRKQQAVNGIEKDAGIDDLDEDKHPEFLASRGQLMFGRVLGDAFGIHEVFAALLSPTGGLVGPGNWLIPGVVDAAHLDPDNPVALHGCLHDAAGYLLTFHGEGPGYNYLDSDIELVGTDSPLSGQISGIAHWVAEVGDDYIERRVDEAVMAVDRALEPARSAVTAGIDDLISGFQSEMNKAVGTIEEAVMDVAQAIDYAARNVSETRVEASPPIALVAGGTLKEDVLGKLQAMSKLLWT